MENLQASLLALGMDCIRLDHRSHFKVDVRNPEWDHWPALLFTTLAGPSLLASALGDLRLSGRYVSNTLDTRRNLPRAEPSVHTFHPQDKHGVTALHSWHTTGMKPWMLRIWTDG